MHAPAHPPSADALAIRRDLLVATAALQRLQLAPALRARSEHVRAGWRLVSLVLRLAGALAPRWAPERWDIVGHLLALWRALRSRRSA